MSIPQICVRFMRPIMGVSSRLRKRKKAIGGRVDSSYGGCLSNKMNGWKTLVLLTAVGSPLVYALGPTPVERLKPPTLALKESGRAITSTKNGGVRWKNEWSSENTVLDGKPVVRFTEAGSGRYAGFDGEVAWQVETTWSAEDWFRPIRTSRIVTDPSGVKLLREQRSFDFAKGIVEQEQELRSGARSRRTLKIPADTITVDGIAAALRSLPFATARPFRLHVLSNDSKLYEVTLHVRGRERVKTPAGEFDCYKVEMVPALGILNVLRPFIPKTYFWFAVNPPHAWVRYEGLENGPGTPLVVMDLVAHERTN